MPAQPEERLLSKLFSAARIARSAKKISENRHPQLLEVRDHLLIESHRRRTVLSTHSHSVLKKEAAREVARIKHHLSYYITDAGRLLRVAGKINSDSRARAAGMKSRNFLRVGKPS